MTITRIYKNLKFIGYIQVKGTLEIKSFKEHCKKHCSEALSNLDNEPSLYYHEGHHLYADRLDEASRNDLDWLGTKRLILWRICLCNYEEKAITTYFTGDELAKIEKHLNDLGFFECKKDSGINPMELISTELKKHIRAL